MLLTHKGVSGPAVLRLSAFAARSLFADNYKSRLIVNWIGKDIGLAKKLMNIYRYEKGSRTLSSACPFANLPKRLWLALLKQVQIDPFIRWSELTSEAQIKFTNALVSSSYLIKGRGPFGEEFVTAGGIILEQVNLKKMESRVCSGLYFAGEILDIDGVTGGFNFQHCWTSGWLAGKAIANNF